MFIKYQWVKLAVLSLVVAGAGTLIVLFATGAFDSEKTLPAESTVNTQAAPPNTASAPIAQARTVYPSQDAHAMAAANYRAVPNNKTKDALTGPNTWKVNLYEETGDTHFDRAKIDKNRDEVWDEKWTYKEGRWEKDDGTLFWSGDAWVSAAAPPVEPTAPPEPHVEVTGNTVLDSTPGAPKGDSDLADVARRVLNERATNVKAKDINGGTGIKINLYDDDADGHWDRAKIDRERDEDWEEKWTVKEGRLERNKGGVVSVFQDGIWVSVP